jgi:ankyrin repeat protein
MIQCVRMSLGMTVAAMMLIPVRAARAEALFQAVRNGDLGSLRKNVSSINIETRGARGATLLMHAAALGNVETVRFLIDSGADINAKNDLGATALLWAARDPDKARLLIEHGADVNVQSKQGRTPLMLAALRDGGSDIVALMLAKGAKVNAADGVGDTALLLAAEIGNIETMRLLIAKGADVHAINRYGDSTLFAAARGRRTEAVRLMIEKGVDPNLATTWFPSVRNGQIAQLKLVALDRAANFGPVQMVRDLLKAGANVNAQDSRGLTPLMFAVSAENQKAEIVQTLIAAGADVNIRSATGETALDWAEKFGYPEVITALKQAAAAHGVEYQAPHRPQAPQPDAATAVARSIELLQKSSSEYFVRSACVGCHHQPLIAQVLQTARTAGVLVNETAAREQALQLKAQWASSQDEFLQALNPPGGANSLGEILLGLAAAGIAASPVIDSGVASLAESQMADGSWLSSEKQNRPPITESIIASTTRAIRVLSQYPIPARKTEFEHRIDHAKAWLKDAKPRSTDDFAMRLLGLFWAGASAAQVGQAAHDLMALQKQDGGWAGNAYLASDAFSTGEALYALHESGMASSEPAYRRGADYLLATQYPDGSWYVRSRSVKFQPYFESAFPFGHDQWISAAATGWATMALAPCVAERGSNRVAGR